MARTIYISVLYEDEIGVCSSSFRAVNRKIGVSFPLSPVCPGTCHCIRMWKATETCLRRRFIWCHSDTKQNGCHHMILMARILEILLYEGKQPNLSPVKSNVVVLDDVVTVIPSTET